MKAITFSLLFVVLLSSLSIGWFIDAVYDEILPPEQRRGNYTIDILESIGKGLAKTIDAQQDKAQFLKTWPQTEDLSLTLMTLRDFQLPSNLLATLKRGKPLTLESDNGIAIYLYLPTTAQILLLRSEIINRPDYAQDIKLALTMVFYLALSLLLTIWVYPLARRLLVLRKAAQAFGSGQLGIRVKPGSIGYVNDLESEFNRMAEKIEVLLSDIKLLSGGVSHDLKTPLSRLRFGIDALDEEPDSGVRQGYLQRLSNDTDEMINLVDTMLEYTRLDQSLSSIPKQTLDFGSLISDAVARHQDTHIVIDTRFENPQDVSDFGQFEGHATYISMLLNNLIGNAIRYAKTKVKVSLIQNTETIKLVVEDDGKGIDVIHQQDVFKPFFRLTSEANAGNADLPEKHYGIGLAMAKRIAEVHNGKIDCKKTYDKNELSGASFVVVFSTP